MTDRDPVGPSPALWVVRPAGLDDSRLIWQWRNDPVTRQMAKSNQPIPWSEHERWFAATLASELSVLYVVETGGVAVAMVRFDVRGATAEVSINVDPTARGQGIGKQALAAACDRFVQERAPRQIVADVRRSNSASQRIFAATGFAPVGVADEFMTFVRAFESADSSRLDGA